MYEDIVKALKIIFNEKYDKMQPSASFNPNICREHIIVIERNHTIIYQKDPVKYFYFLLSGRTVILNHIEWNDDNIIDYVKPPHILGLVEYLNDTSSYTAFVMADTKCVLFQIAAEDFIQIIKQDAALCYQTLVLQGKTTDANMAHAELTNIFHPKDKLGHYLYIQAQHHIPYVYKMTRRDLSNELHINLRTLYRYIDSMKDNGYLTLHKGKIVIKEDHFEKLAGRYNNVIL